MGILHKMSCWTCKLLDGAEIADGHPGRVIPCGKGLRWYRAIRASADRWELGTFWRSML